MLLLIIAALPMLQGDVGLEGPALTKFLRTKGASQRGQDVHWHVPASVFTGPPKTRRKGFLLFETKGIGILVAADSRELAEVQRRGGTACLRGIIRPVPKPKKNGPTHYLDVRQMRHRKK